MDDDKKIILTANLGNFDNNVDPVKQSPPIDFHRWTDENYPPNIGLTPRLQYRIPKTHGWQMRPGYDKYIWLDGSMSFTNEDDAQWHIDKLGDDDILLYKHPWRSTVKEEVEHIEDHLRRKRPYITRRYAGGWHREFLDRMTREGCPDDTLYASMVFAYKNTPRVQSALADWWYLGSLYFTCDQVQLPYIVWKYNLSVKVVEDDPFDSDHIKLRSSHK